MWSHILLFVCQGKCVIQFLFCLSVVSLSNGQSILANFFFVFDILFCHLRFFFHFLFDIVVFFLIKLHLKMCRALKIVDVLCVELNFQLNFLKDRNYCCQLVHRHHQVPPIKMNINGFTKAEMVRCNLIFSFLNILLIEFFALSSSSNGNNNVLSFRLVAI